MSASSVSVLLRLTSKYLIYLTYSSAAPFICIVWVDSLVNEKKETGKKKNIWLGKKETGKKEMERKKQFYSQQFHTLLTNLFSYMNFFV